MKIRIMGKKNELEAVSKLLWSKFKDQIVSISKFYPNRGMTEQGRIYVETTTQSFMGYQEDKYQLEFKI